MCSVYQAVVDGVSALLGAEIASLRFRDRPDPSWTIAHAAVSFNATCD